MEFTPPDNHWVLAWSDEFNATTLDDAKWNIREGVRQRGLWKHDNLKLSNGVLTFYVRPESGLVTSVGIDTKHKLEFTRGYIVVRAKLPHTPGYRPAFWITSDSVNQVGNEGKDGTEIDVFEQPGRSGRIFVNLHWDGYGADHKTTGSSFFLSNFDQWHTFGVEWSINSYTFYCDGVEVWQSDAGGVSQAPEYLKLGVDIPETEKDPTGVYDKLKAVGQDVMQVDYVRVYKALK